MQGFMRGADGGPLFDSFGLLAVLAVPFILGVALGAGLVWIF